MSTRYTAIAAVMIVLTLAVGCGKAEPTVTPAPPMDTPAPPTATTVLPTDTPEPSSFSVEVPPGNPATIDGTFSPGEWDGALATELTNGGELLLMYNEGHLFLGIRSKEMGYGSICIAQDDQISILHSSAALGTAVFEKDDGEDDWKRTRQFSWCCRSKSDSPERQAYLQREGWIASIGYMGPPDEMEYQITMNEETLTLAVVYQEGSSRNSAFWWPENLDDDCLGIVLLSDNPPERLQFSPETWVIVVASAVTDGDKGEQLLEGLRLREEAGVVLLEN